MIAKRAIAEYPERVIAVAYPYIQGLQASGVKSTLKHFLGLARVTDDTHLFAADLDVSLAELMQEDWLPFKVLGHRTQAWMMLSHVTLTAVDADNPISTSKKVVNNIIRDKLGYNGILITDDLTMGATFSRGFCKSVRAAYDAEQYYEAVICLSAR